MSLMNTPQLTLAEKFLDLATARQSLLVSNIANVDTPGYRTQDMDFHSEMLRALNEDPDMPAVPTVRDVPGLLSRPDGNNVSVDREGLLLAELQLKYQAATEAIRQEFALLRAVVTNET